MTAPMVSPAERTSTPAAFRALVVNKSISLCTTEPLVFSQPRLAVPGAVRCCSQLGPTGQQVSHANPHSTGQVAACEHARAARALIGYAACA